MYINSSHIGYQAVKVFKAIHYLKYLLPRFKLYNYFVSFFCPMRYRFIFILALSATVLSGQKKQCLILNTDGIKSEQKCFMDSIDANRFLRSKIESNATNGFLEISVDSVTILTDTSRLIFIHQGPKYRIAQMSWKLTDSQKKQLHLKEKEVLIKKVNIQKQRPKFRKKLKNFWENGYPFARIWFENIDLNTDSVTLDIKMDLGPRILMSDITIENPNLKLPDKFWYGILNFQKGRPCDLALLNRTDNRVREIPFLDIGQPSELVFKNNEVSVRIWPISKKANRFDVILGLQPSNTIGNTSRRLVLTGQLTADVYNTLNYGERLFLDFKSFQNGDQNLNLGIQWPFLLASNIGMDGQFSILKRDTSSVDIQSGLSANFPIKEGLGVRLNYLNSISNILSVPVNSILQTGNLPGLLDFRRNSLGIEVYRNTLNFIVNPRSGLDAKISFQAGIRNLKRNPKIISLSNDNNRLAAQYDSLSSSKNQYRLEFQADYYWNFSGNLVLKTGLRGAGIFGNTVPLRNELYRIGGYKLLRGFDEQSIEVNQYGMLTSELRLLVSPYSYIGFFVDWATYVSKYGLQDIQEQALGFGVNASLETKSGVISVAAGVGRKSNQAFDFRSPRIHFGYLSVF